MEDISGDGELHVMFLDDFRNWYKILCLDGIFTFKVCLSFRPYTLVLKILLAIVTSWGAKVQFCIMRLVTIATREASLGTCWNWQTISAIMMLRLVNFFLLPGIVAMACSTWAMSMFDLWDWVKRSSVLMPLSQIQYWNNQHQDVLQQRKYTRTIFFWMLEDVSTRKYLSCFPYLSSNQSQNCWLPKYHERIRYLQYPKGESTQFQLLEVLLCCWW